MSSYFNRPLYSMIGSAPWTRDLLPRPAGHIRSRFRGLHQARMKREEGLRLEERRKERETIARELHDTLFQGFLGASLLLHSAVQKMPADSPGKLSLDRALQQIARVLDEGRGVLQGLRSTRATSAGLEHELRQLGEEFAPGNARLQIFVLGRPRALNPTVQEQLYLIGREAVVNALRHSGAANIEVEVEYLPEKLRVVVRDDGSGIDTQLLRAKRDSHWGLLGMRERASAIGAQLAIWSRAGAGTEVEVSLASDLSVDDHNGAPH